MNSFPIDSSKVVLDGIAYPYSIFYYSDGNNEWFGAYVSVPDWHPFYRKHYTTIMEIMDPYIELSFSNGRGAFGFNTKNAFSSNITVDSIRETIYRVIDVFHKYRK